MYIDEVGNSDLGSSSNPNHRYLNLTAVIISLDCVKTDLQPRLNEIKEEYFGDHHDPDDPVILHRKEIVNAKTPFANLRNPARKKGFDKEILNLISELEYTIIGVLVDKQAHKQMYGEWANDPYHYCLEVLMERYVLFLESLRRKGDIIAESRGGKEDNRLKEVFRRLYQTGTDNITANRISSCLTSKELKVSPKKANVAGLQFADLLAHPVYKSMIAAHEKTVPPENYGRRIYTILEKTKLRRNPRNGTIEGWGLKWLP